MLLYLLLAGSAAAQTPLDAAPLDPIVVEAFVDAVMNEALANTYAPGAVVTVVQGDGLVLAKGYGFANVQTRARIDPERTLFRIASVTKLFTTVAALRLEEQGKLDLDADINRYLTRVRVPETFADPITARELLTHHGGFETAVGYMDFPDEHAAEENSTQMSWDISRVRPVSALPIYDNMGFGVLGLVVADILGTSYAQAMRQLVFTPLQMNQSVSGLPESRIADAAHAHMRDAQWQAKLIPQNLMPTSAQGGGDISSTAVDMGKFLSGLLVPGKLLQPATLAEMTDFDTWRFHPQVPGLGLGMWQYFYHGHNAEGHRGEINGFISRIALFRESGIGIFVSVNSTVQAWPQPRLSYVLTHLSAPMPPPGARTLDPDGLIDGLLEQFADRFLGPPPVRPTPGPMNAGEPTVDQLGGVYFRLDASDHLMVRMLATMDAQRITAMPGGQMSLWGCPLIRMAPLYYECKTPTGQIVPLGFRVVDGNRIFASVQPVGALERQPVWRQAPFAIWPIPILTLLGLSALVIRACSSGQARRRVLTLAGSGTLMFLLALLLELQFAYDLSHSALHDLPMLWRVLFPIAAAFLLASAWLITKGFLTAGATEMRSQKMLTVYLAALALGSLGLVWLIFLWGLAWPL